MACSALLELSTDDVPEATELRRDPEALAMSGVLDVDGWVASAVET